MKPERVDLVSHTEINSTLPGADVNATQCSAKDGGADKGTESDLAGMGRALQASPPSDALPQTRRWNVRRVWSHRFRRWRTRGSIRLPKVKLYEEFGLVNPIPLIPSLGSHSRS
jgi:hypothetical protein